jgi:hypothetical protein
MELTVKNLATLIELNGETVSINTRLCVEWKAYHLGDCTGCPSELGCRKIINMFSLIALYELGEDVFGEKGLLGNLEIILAAKSVEEILLRVEVKN